MINKLVFLCLLVGSCYSFNKITAYKITIQNFVSPWNDEAFGATKFNYWKDADWFHFSFEVEDETIILANNKNSEEQNVLYSDRVELFFAKDSLMQPYYTLEMDAKGRLFDAKCSKGKNAKIDSDWNWPANELEINGKTNEQGYKVEGKISLKSLQQFGLINDESIYCGIMRANFLNDKKVQWITWKNPNLAKADFHNWGVFGKLELD